MEAVLNSSELHQVVYDSEGGTDISIAEKKVAYACNIEFPRLEGPREKIRISMNLNRSCFDLGLLYVARRWHLLRSGGPMWRPHQ